MDGPSFANEFLWESFFGQIQLKGGKLEGETGSTFPAKYEFLKSESGD